MSTKRGFVREGLEATIDAKEIFTPTDYFSVVLYYKLIKDGAELQSILPKRTEFEDAPLELAEGLDDIIHSMIDHLEDQKIDLTRQDANLRDVNLFSFIMHDPVLKQAIGNVAIQVFMRDEKTDYDSAKQRTLEVLPDLMGDFQEMFLPNMISRTLPQIFRRMDMHGIEQKDALEMLEPQVATIGYEAIRKHGFKIGEELSIGLDFKQPVIDTTMGDESHKSDADSMFG